MVPCCPTSSLTALSVPTAYHRSLSPTVSLVESDIIVEQSETEYNPAGQVILQTHRQRFHNAVGTGALNGPAGPEPKSRDSYVASWYDGVGRGIATANYGTNNNAGPPARPASPPESTDDVLVSFAHYNAAGEAFETVDSAGMINRIEYDQAGRAFRTIQNYQPSDNGCGCFGDDVNITTETHYSNGQRVTLIAKNPATGDQITHYEFGVTLDDSDLASNELLRAEIYPDTSDGNDQVTYSYNRQGQRTTMTDQNGTTHEYTYDGLGRATADAVAVLGAGVDGSVRRIAWHAKMLAGSLKASQGVYHSQLIC